MGGHRASLHYGGCEYWAEDVGDGVLWVRLEVVEGPGMYGGLVECEKGLGRKGRDNIGLDWLAEWPGE